jgi:HEAT repeat protein
LPHLIDLLPAADPPREERLSRHCVLTALARLTGRSVGLEYRFVPDNPPDARADWRAWYAANRDYLYTPADGADPRGRRVAVDLEAKLARTPADVYRRDRPRVRQADVRAWRDDPGYEAALREYCFGVLLDSTDGRSGEIFQLAAVPGPRALAALHGMCELETDVDDAYHLITALGERGDPASLPVIERVPRPAGGKADRSHAEERRAHEVERLRLRVKHGPALAGKPLYAEQQHLYLRCLDGDRGVAELVAELGNRDHDVFLATHAEVAGYVDRAEVRAALRRVAADDTRPDRAKAEAHAALTRLGEAGSLAHLRRSLAHPTPMVRLTAAKGLWRLGHRDGVRTLIELLDARPLETGQEGIRVGEGSFTVTAVRGGTVDAVRGACVLLGEIGDTSAVEPLRRLLSGNLNGVAEGGGGGTAWAGRPDAVALARLGDFTGIPVLRAAVARGDRIDVVPGRSAVGDFVAIGRRPFAAELLPLLAHHDAQKRASAARDILVLLDGGR